MIKFFRHIRQRMIKENRVSKYLLYAIGEIVLVVIGILIALSINNWNQERVNRAKSNELLVGIVKDLGQDVTVLDRSIGYYDSRLAFLKRQLSKSDFSNTATDTLFAIFDASAILFNITDQSYEKAKNLGISRLSSNDSLSLKVDNYYTETLGFTELLYKFQYDEFKKLNDFWMKDQEGLEFQHNTSFPLLQDSLERRSNAIAGVTSPRGRNHISSEYFLLENLLRFQKETRKIAEGLRRDIQEYLEQ